MDKLTAQVIADLTAFSSQLLEAGVAPMRNYGQGTISQGGTTVVLRAAKRLSSLVPRLLETVETEEARDAYGTRFVRTPVRTRYPRAPWCFGVRNSETRQLTPVVWEHLEEISHAAGGSLRWLLYILEHVAAMITVLQARTSKHVDDALRTRAGSSSYAAEEQRSLLSLVESLRHARVNLAGSMDLVKEAAPGSIRSSSRRPHPYPAGTEWRALRTEVAGILDPKAFLPSFITALLTQPVVAADLPYLYQRWCGLQLLKAFERAGWTFVGDVAETLYLGGSLELTRGSVVITLWVEPRLTLAKQQELGFHSGVIELTPDYLIVTSGPFGRDGFVLDATRSTDETIVASKSKYLDLMIGSDSLYVAGVPVRRRLRASWAAAPVGGHTCSLLSPDGSVGVIPMGPDVASARAVDAWVGDITSHSILWAPVARPARSGVEG